MSRVREAPAGCIVYFMLSIVINLFILILRISALEVQNNSTLATTNYRTIPTASLQTTNDDTGATESGKMDSKYIHVVPCTWSMMLAFIRLFTHSHSMEFCSLGFILISSFMHTSPLCILITIFPTTTTTKI